MQRISSQISRIIWFIRVAKTMRDNEKNKILRCFGDKIMEKNM